MLASVEFWRTSRLPDPGSPYLIKPHQSLVHETLPGPNLRRGDLWVGTVPTFRRRFNRWEVLMVSIAVSEEEQRVESSPFSQADSMLAKELSACTDKGYVFV
jgi:hypothetical protein